MPAILDHLAAPPAGFPPERRSVLVQESEEELALSFWLDSHSGYGADASSAWGMISNGQNWVTVLDPVLLLLDCIRTQPILPTIVSIWMTMSCSMERVRRQDTAPLVT
jgi:hypothetical protein